MLYSIENPAIGGMAGKEKAEAHVCASGDITGAVGNMTTLTKLLSLHEPVPVDPLPAEPQFPFNT